jgi:hypothetical protein
LLKYLTSLLLKLRIKKVELLGFNKKYFSQRLSFGASLLKRSHAKTARPLSSKHALHVVLRSEIARGPRSLLKKERLIHNLILKQGRRHRVKVFHVANGGDHLHLLVRFYKRRNFQNFLRAVSGLIARKTLGLERGRVLDSKECNSTSWLGKFWDQRPFTRIVSWGPDFNALRSYLKSGMTEALGFLPRKHVIALGTQEIYKRLISQISLIMGLG